MPRPAALLLAAGRSLRMGAGRHKLLATSSRNGAAAYEQSPSAPASCTPLIRHVALTTLAAQIASLTVVTGHRADEIRNALAGLPGEAHVSPLPSLHFVHNPDHASGIASSLRHGLQALPDDSAGVLVMLADMPHLTTEHLNLIIASHLANPHAIVVPTHEGQRGNPLLWPRRYVAAMMSLQGDQGARQLLSDRKDSIIEVVLPDEAILVDMDTPEDASRLGFRF